MMVKPRRDPRFYLFGSLGVNKPLVLPGVDIKTLVYINLRVKISEGLATASQNQNMEVYDK